MVFYIDPCYNGKIAGISMCEAIYTYSSIPKDLIEDKCFVYSIKPCKNGKYDVDLSSINSF